MNGETALAIIKKTTEDYKKISDEFIATRIKPWPLFNYFKKYVKDADKVLDAGCGTGRLIEIFKGTNVEYSGFDTSESSIVFSQKTYNSFLTIPPVFVVKDMVDFPWPVENESFDIIFMIAVFHHIPSAGLRQEVLREAQRVLKPGGKLIMTNWDLRSIWAVKKFWPEILRTFFPRSNLDRGDFFTPWKLKKIPLNPPLVKGEIKGDLKREERIFRFYHSFSLREIKKEIRQSGLTILENYYTVSGERSNFLFSRNILTIAQK